jgi:hypothetical protein
MAAAALLVLLLINIRLYRFFAGRRGRLFAFAAVPLHALYFLYSGLALGCGVGVFLWQTVSQRTSLDSSDA